MTTNPSRIASWCAAIGTALLLSSCMTTDGYGGSPSGGQYPGGQYPGGQYPGGQYPQQPQSSANQLVGTVQAVDTSGRLTLDSESGYGGGGVDVYFDQRTTLYYQGQSYPVTGLERGDRIRIDTTQSGGRLWARSIEVLQNVRDGGQYGSQGGQYGNQGSQYGNAMGGAVTFVDARSRVLAFTGGGYSGTPTQVNYDDRTVVEFRGQRLRPEDLQRGDVVRIQARQWGNGWLAERIVVETSARARY